jgi:3-oxoacyl-[acyl-carrier-protein] synthase-3
MAVPATVWTNAKLEQMVDTSDEWIWGRTGIRERRIATDGETTATLAVEAAQGALTEAGVGPEAVDLIIVATVTPEMPFPATACFVQDELGASRAAAMDLNAACSGFLYGLSLADALIRTGSVERALIIGSETLSKIVDWSDRATCVLFGDGAGAVVLERSDDGERGILASYMRSDGGGARLLYMPGGGSRCPATPETVEARLHHIKMEGRGLFKEAALMMDEAVARVLEIGGYRKQEMDLLIPHQANLRIIRATARRMGLPMEKVLVNLDRYGNTSAATIPIALYEAQKAGRVGPGSLVGMVAFGGGLTWGAVLVRF